MGNSAYIFGGYDSGYIDEILRYDPTSDTITEMSSTFDTPIAATAASWTGDGAYIFGGQTGVISSNVYHFDPASDSIRLLDEEMPSPRYGSTAVVGAEGIYLLGGQESPSEAINEIIRFDPRTEQFSNLGDELSSPRSFAAGAVVDDEILLVGGFDGSAPTSEILSYRPGESLHWTLATQARWISIDPDSGILSGTPGPLDEGEYDLNVAVFDDHRGIAWRNLTLSVAGPELAVVPADPIWPEIPVYVKVGAAGAIGGGILVLLISQFEWIVFALALIPGTLIATRIRKENPRNPWADPGDHNLKARSPLPMDQDQ